MARYLVDTDVLIDAARGREPARSRLLAMIAAGDELGVCAVQLTEFYSGQPRGQQPAWDAFLDSAHFWRISREAAVRAGVYRRTLGQRGRTVSTPDALNAAVAWHARATIITGNVRDYPMPDVRVLAL